MDFKAVFANVVSKVKENKNIVVPIATGIVGALVGAGVGFLATRDVGPDLSWEPTAEEQELGMGSEDEVEEGDDQ